MRKKIDKKNKRWTILFFFLVANNDPGIGVIGVFTVYCERSCIFAPKAKLGGDWNVP